MFIPKKIIYVIKRVMLNINHNSFLESQSQMDIFLLFQWTWSNQDIIMHNEKMLQDSNF